MTDYLARKDWPIYTVSTQRAPGDDIVVRRFKCESLEDVSKLVMRLHCIQFMHELNIYEVSQDVIVNGKLETHFIIGNPNAQWPPHIKVIHDPVIYSPLSATKLPRELPKPPDHIRDAVSADRQIMMPLKPRREIEHASYNGGAPTNVRMIGATMRAKREQHQQQQAERKPKPSERSKPMQRLLKKVA